MITIQIGNTDNKLTQVEWSEFVRETREIIEKYSTVYFFGGSVNWAKWQNVAWCIKCNDEYNAAHLKNTIKRIREFFKQDSVSWTEGETEFI